MAGETNQYYCEGGVMYTFIKTENYKKNFEAVAINYIDRLYYSAFQLTKNKSDAEDLVQETYLKAYRSFHAFKPGTNFKAWIHKILYNNFVNLYRKKKKAPIKADWEKALRTHAEAPKRQKELESHQSPLEIFDDEISQALLKLPAKYLEVVMLVDVQNLSYKETANVLKCPDGTVMSRLSRARGKLRYLLGGSQSYKAIVH